MSIEEMTVMGNIDMKKSVKRYMNENASVPVLEEFLGYQITADVIEGKEDYIKEVLLQMPEEEIVTFYNKYCQ